MFNVCMLAGLARAQVNILMAEKNFTIGTIRPGVVTVELVIVRVLF